LGKAARGNASIAEPVDPYQGSTTPPASTAVVQSAQMDAPSGVGSVLPSGAGTPSHGAAAHTAEATPVQKNCSAATFAAIYDAPEPAQGAVRAALSSLKACHDSGAITNDEFDQYQSALVAKL
jgi:hypothetical protein